MANAAIMASVANVYRMLGVNPPNQATLQRLANEIEGGRSWTHLRESIVSNEAKERGVSRERVYIDLIRSWYTERGATQPSADQMRGMILDLNSGAMTLSQLRGQARTAVVVKAPPSSTGGGGGQPPEPDIPDIPGGGSGGGGGTPGGGGGEPDIPDPEPIDYKAKVKALYPWLAANLVNIFAEKWAESGDQSLALAELRASDAYDQAFQGIKRADGSLRMSEQEWFSTREAYGRLFSEFGLNTTLFTDRFTELMEGDVSPSELAARLGGAYEQIVGNIEGVRQAYSQWFGDGMSDAAIFASFIDPNIGDGILNRRISIAQVGGEGLARGFDVDMSFAERLVGGGVNQESARAFYVSAEGQLQTLDTLAQRHRDPDDSFDLVDFADANVFGDASQNRRIQRLLRAEASLFSDQLGTLATGDDMAVTGLRAR